MNIGKPKPFFCTPSWPIAAALLLLSAAGSVYAQTATPCHVTPTGSPSNNGMSWATPVDLQSALQNNSCKEIWVRKGIYKPTSDASDRSASFTLARYVEMYGGFDGNAQSRGDRDPGAHLTILSGDIDDNDMTNAAGVTENYHDQRGRNSYHVLMLDGTAAGSAISSWTILDGFVITAGKANDIANRDGGGLHCNGAGVGSNCSPSLTDMAFIGNGASYHGGGMYLDARNGGNSSPLLDRVVFSGNNAYDNFTTNGGSGGAMAIYAHSGGVSSPTLTDVVFRNNRANWYGGAVFNESFGADAISNPTFTRVTFVNNTAVWDGGGMYNIAETNGSTKPALLNVTFVGNSAGTGAAIGNLAWGGTTWPDITNATFAGNSSSRDWGGAIHNNIQYFTGTVGANLVNVILWDSVDGVEISNKSGSVSIDYSVVRGGSSGIVGNGGASDPAFGNGTLNINGDPLLGPLWNNGGFTKTMLLGMNSAAVDNGDDDACPNQDQRGAPRLVRNQCDIGAVEQVLPDSDIIFQNGFDLY